MPNAVVKSYAKETGKSVEHVERWWDEAKEQALKKFPKKGPEYWAYVNGIVEKRGKLVHGKKKKKRKTNEGLEMLKMTFKEFIGEAKKKSLPTEGDEFDQMMDAFISENGEDAEDMDPMDGTEYLIDTFQNWLVQHGHDENMVEMWMSEVEDKVFDYIYNGLT